MATGPSTTNVAPGLEALLKAKDEDFQPYTWQEAKDIIVKDRLDALDRWPSDARRYVTWSDTIRSQYGSITNFICKERLRWKPLPENQQPTESGSLFAYKSPVPFAHASDYKILRNDWPYRWEPGITHICVWLKNRLPMDPGTGRLTVEGREMIAGFVRRTFIESLGEDGGEKVLWFKNWTTLQSVAALEHFHVLVRDVPEWKILEWTDMDTTIHEE